MSIYRLKRKRILGTLSKLLGPVSTTVPSLPVPPPVLNTRQATLSSSLLSLTSSSLANLRLKASGSNGLQSVSLSSTGRVLVKATLNKTLNNLTTFSSGFINNNHAGLLAKSLNPLLVSSSSKLLLKGSANKSLGSLSLTSQSSVTNALRLGLNLETTYYGTNNLVWSDVQHAAVPVSLPSNVTLPAANFSSDQQPASLPGTDNKIRYFFQTPEQAGMQYVVLFTPGASSVTAFNATTVGSPNMPGGMVTVIPSANQPTNDASGVWWLDFTKDTAVPKIVSALPVGDGSTLTNNFLTHVSALSCPGGPLRDMDMTGCNKNEGVTVSSVGQAFPPAVVTASNRNLISGACWLATDGNGDQGGGGKKGDGQPFEASLLLANTCNRPLWRTLPWNASNDYYDSVADYAALNASHETYFEVGNEVWNWNFPVTSQSRYEGISLGLIDMEGGVLVTNGPNERYVDKTIDVMERIKARYVANGTPLSKLKRVLSIQASTSDYWAPLFLDYAPTGKTALKNHIDVIAIAPYIGQGDVPSSSTIYSDYVEAMYSGIDDIIDGKLASVVTAATARGIEVALYEGGQSLEVSDATTRNALQTGSDMYNVYMHYLARIARVAPSAAFANFILTTNDFGNESWGILRYSGKTPGSDTPKYNAIKDFILGKRKLIPLSGTLATASGATVGTIVGTLRRRTPGSMVTISPASLAFVDPNAQILQVKIADASAFTSAGTLSWSTTETDARDAIGSHTTTGTLVIHTNLVLNGTFASSSNWTTYSGATISGGQVNCVNAAQIIDQNVGLTNGLSYTVSFTYNATSGLNLRVNNSQGNGVNTVLDLPITTGSPQFFTGTFTALGPYLSLQASRAVYNGSIDNVILYQN
jgi:hypothetical protein